MQIGIVAEALGQSGQIMEAALRRPSSAPSASSPPSVDDIFCLFMRRLRLPNANFRHFLSVRAPIAVAGQLFPEAAERMQPLDLRFHKTHPSVSARLGRFLMIDNRNRRTNSQKWMIFGVRQPQPALELTNRRPRTMPQRPLHGERDARRALGPPVQKRIFPGNPPDLLEREPDERPTPHRSRLSALRRKSKSPMVTNPSSSRVTLTTSFTTTIFLKESPTPSRGAFSCARLASSGSA